ncbi:MAG: DNA polymerase domain-containing protein, partial [Candidatus Aenigmatarchaeota archaeon]
KSLTGQELQDAENLQYALKTLANAFYGYMGFASSRWYSRVCAKAAAAFGRFYIKQILDLATGGGHEVVYGDTDSLFIKMPSKKAAREFLKNANNSLPGMIEMEFKGMYKRGIFIEAQTGLGAKKKYAMLDENDNLIVRGLETRRRDWSSIAKDTQERILLAVLREKSTPIAIEIVAETIRRLKEGKVNMDDLVIYTQLTKPLDKYEQIGPHVAVAQKMAMRGDNIKEGMTISYVITKGHGSISERAEQPDEAKNYDPDYYIENQVVPAAMRILSAVDVDKELLLRSEEQSNLSGFFMRGHKPK